MSFDDFNSKWPLCDTFPGKQPEESRYARRTDYFRSSDGMVAEIRIRQMRRTISRKPLRQIADLLQAVLDDGICSTHLSGKSARHRNMFAGRGKQALSCWDLQSRAQKHLGRCQRKSRLAYLRRFRSYSDRASVR